MLQRTQLNMDKLTPDNIKLANFKHLQTFWKELTGNFIRSRADLEYVILSNASRYPTQLPGFQTINKKRTLSETDLKEGSKTKKTKIELNHIAEQVHKTGALKHLREFLLPKPNDTYDGVLCVSRINEHNKEECGANQYKWFKSLLNLVPSKLYIQGEEVKMTGECRLELVDMKKHKTFVVQYIVRTNGDHQWYLENQYDEITKAKPLTDKIITDIISQLKNKSARLSVYEVLINNLRISDIETEFDMHQGVNQIQNVNLVAGSTRMFPGMSWAIRSDMIYLHLPFSRTQSK